MTEINRTALYERHVTKLEELIPAAEEVAGLLDDISVRARQVDADVAGSEDEGEEERQARNWPGLAAASVAATRGQRLGRAARAG